MEKPREIDQKIKKITLKIAMVGVFSALGVLLGSLNPFAFMGENIKVFPFAHTINVITGVLLGPWYAVLTATIIAIIRWSTHMGTINAFSGGIPGALIVGLFAWVFTKKDPKFRPFSAFFEPIGTVIIGATISTYIPLNPSLPVGEGRP